ncbi:MAG: hypothetical protein F4Z14_10235 [Gammaproteobacteria bacterium]|nr:hypothetical protein [Gammaproteobacteria bacterium]
MKWKRLGNYYALLPESPDEKLFLLELLDVLDATILTRNFTYDDVDAIGRYHDEIYDMEGTGDVIRDCPTELWTAFQERIKKLIESRVEIVDSTHS